MPLAASIGATRKYGIAASRVKPDYEPHRHIIEPYKAGFTLLYGGQIIGKNAMKKDTVMASSKALIETRKTDQLKTRNQDFGVLPYQFEAADTEASVTPGTTFTQGFLNTDGIKAGDILKSLTTGETYYVSAKSGLNCTLNVQAGSGQAITAGDRFVKTGSAMHDFWTYGTGITMEPEEYFNYIQTHVNEVGIGRLAMEQGVYPDGNGNAEDRMVVLQHHLVGREMAALDGVKASTTQGGETVQTSDGLRSLAEIVIDAGGSVSYDTFRKDLELRFSKPGGDRWMVGSLVKANTAAWLEAKVVTNQKEEIYGVDIDTVQGIYKHKLHFTEPMENYPGEVVSFKPENIVRNVLGDLDSLFIEDVHASNTAGKVDAYVTAEDLNRTDEEALTRLTGWVG